VGEWFEGFFDEFWSAVFGHPPSRELAERHARAVAGLLGVAEDDAVLDVPCGVGWMSVPLARLGLRVTGLDLNAAYLGEARGQAETEGVDLRLVRGDMREMDCRGEFDGALNWGGSFGYFSEADDLRYSRRVCEALKPGGRFLIDAVNRPWLEAHCPPRTELVRCGIRLRQMSRFDPHSGRYRAIWTYSKGGRQRRHRLSMRVYGPDELRDLLRQAGFGDVAFHGGPPPIAPYDASCRRMIAVATREHLGCQRGMP